MAITYYGQSTVVNAIAATALMAIQCWGRFEIASGAEALSTGSPPIVPQPASWILPPVHESSDRQAWRLAAETAGEQRDGAVEDVRRKN